MVNYTRNQVFEVREKTLKTREKTRIYRDIRRYVNNDKNTFYLPWEDLLVMVEYL